MKKHCYNIAIFPRKTDSNNKYLQIMTDCIKKTGANICSFKTIFKSWRCFCQTDIVILNWFESLGIRNRLRRYIKRKIQLSLLLIFRKKIIFTFHNIMPHNESNSFLSKQFIKYICRKSDKIIILCSASKQYLTKYLSSKTIENKTFLIPHPHYIEAYKKSATEDANKFKGLFSEKKINFLFMGVIRPYKNIELIIDIAKSYQDASFRFVIAGEPFSNAYKQQLKEQAQGLENVRFFLEFVPDDEMVQLLEKCDVLVLPYDKTTSLNSGTVLLAFSNKKTVICPKIGTILEYPLDLTFSYTYENQDDHFKQLKNIFSAFASLPLDSIKQQAKTKGERIFTLVEEKNSLELISSKYSELLQRL